MIPQAKAPQMGNKPMDPPLQVEDEESRRLIKHPCELEVRSGVLLCGSCQERGASDAARPDP